MKETQTQKPIKTILIRCINCIYCGLHSNRTQPICRCHPPIAESLAEKCYSWPIVNPQHDYCGEFCTSDSERFSDFAPAEGLEILRKEIQKIIKNK